MIEEGSWDDFGTQVKDYGSMIKFNCSVSNGVTPVPDEATIVIPRKPDRTIADIKRELMIAFKLDPELEGIVIFGEKDMDSSADIPDDCDVVTFDITTMRQPELDNL
jgi:propanediol dehydratase large subunit